MKILFLLIAFLSTISYAGSSIQVHAIKNEQGVIQHYHIITWSGENEAMVVTKYTIAEVQTQFGSLLTKGQSGTSGTPDRLILNYDDDGGLKSVEYHVTSGNFERAIKKDDAIPAVSKVDAGTAKTGVETKIGGPIKNENP